MEDCPQQQETEYSGILFFLNWKTVEGNITAFWLKLKNYAEDGGCIFF